jgi:FAD:protein FMN transferase
LRPNHSIAGVFNILTFFLLSSFFFGAERVQQAPILLEGRTMGTTYRIMYFDEPLQRNFQHAVDSLLIEVNKSINTYDSTAEISRFNRSDKGLSVKLPYLYDILRKAKKIYRMSDGAFDPTVMPLVNAWGFGPEKPTLPAASDIDSLKELTGLNKIKFSKRRISKPDPRIQLDMGGIGQGYGADVIFRFLKSQGIENILVELGGEGVALGKNLSKNKPWTIGILDPNSTTDHQFLKAYVKLNDEAFTTSGNYFNYRVIDGRKFGHTIDPVTGYPVQHSLLSSSVFADDCTTADAWATAFMVMGVEKAIEKLKSLERIDALFIYSNKEGKLETFISPGIKDQIILE